MSDVATLDRPVAESGPGLRDATVAGPPPASSTTPMAAIRTYAGLPISTLVLAGLMLVMLLWSVWATRELLALRSHRIVSVSLASLVRDFVAAEARNGGSPEVTAARTRVYISTIGGAVKSMADDGSTVLVSEAVLGNSVPDVTPQLKAAVDVQLRTIAPSAAAEVPSAGGGDGR